MSSAMHPLLILFDGKLYHNAGRKSETDLLVEPNGLLVEQAGEYQEYERDVNEGGPIYIIFYGQIYAMSFADPAMVGDDVPRVQAVQMIHTSRNTIVSDPIQKAIDQYWDTLINSPRSRVTNNEALPMGFYYPQFVRDEERFEIPSYNKAKACQHPGTCICVKRRDAWNPSHVERLKILVEAAMKFLNRDVGLRDFPALTEALVRSFPVGTNNAFPPRGSLAIHSFALKKGTANSEHFKEMAIRVLGI